MLDIDDLKGTYNAARHPDVIQGKRSEDNVLCEFIETFEAHHNLRNNTARDSVVTLEEFLDYYKNVSASVDNDDHFLLILNNSWNITGNAATYKKYEKAWANEEAKEKKQFDTTGIRPSAKPHNVYRSGMGSNDNPLNTTKEYYPPVNNAARNNTTSGAMFSTPKVAPQGDTASGGPPPKESYAAYQNVKPNTGFIKVTAPSTVPKFQGILVQRFRKALRARGGKGIAGLSRQFKIFDDNNSGTLSQDEFVKAIKDFEVDIEEIDLQNLFKTMDYDSSGEIDFNEFLRVVVGEMSAFRKNLVEKAFRTLDINQDGTIALDEFGKKYNATSHPDVRTGKRTEEEVLAEFMDTFQQHHNKANKSTRDNKISLDEFIEYYNHISCNIENDSYFDLMISNTWQLEGSSSNPSSMPFAGTSKKINFVNAREAYRNDHHRNLFGTDKNTPFSKGTS